MRNPLAAVFFAVLACSGLADSIRKSIGVVAVVVRVS
jgi:hypothetical protein